MRNVGLFIGGSLMSGFIVFMGCSSGGSSTGTGGKTTTTGTQTASSTGHGGATSSSTGTGTGGCTSNDAGADGGVALTGNHCNPVTNTVCEAGTSCDYDQDKCTPATTGLRPSAASPAAKVTACCSAIATSK